MSRLQNVLPSIISLAKGTFVHGRKILNGVLIANECLHSRVREIRPGSSYKLNRETAYEIIDKDYLQSMMHSIVVGVRWRAWIKEFVL